MTKHRTTERKKTWAVGLRGLIAIFRVESVVVGIALVLSSSALAALSEPGILTYVANSAVFKYMVWNGTSFDAAADGPTMQGADVIRHIRSARRVRLNRQG